MRIRINDFKTVKANLFTQEQYIQALNQLLHQYRFCFKDEINVQIDNLDEALNTTTDNLKPRNKKYHAVIQKEGMKFYGLCYILYCQFSKIDHFGVMTDDLMSQKIENHIKHCVQPFMAGLEYIITLTDASKPQYDEIQTFNLLLMSDNFEWDF